MSPELQAEMIKTTADTPDKRFESIRKIHSDVSREPSAACDAFGIKIAPQLVEANSKQLAPSPVLYADSRDGSPVQISDFRNGSWNLRNPRGGDVSVHAPRAPSSESHCCGSCAAHCP